MLAYLLNLVMEQRLLKLHNRDWKAQKQRWFGSGTSIVLVRKVGEVALPLFLCQAVEINRRSNGSNSNCVIGQIKTDFVNRSWNKKTNPLVWVDEVPALDRFPITIFSLSLRRFGSGRSSVVGHSLVIKMSWVGIAPVDEVFVNESSTYNRPLTDWCSL